MSQDMHSLEAEMSALGAMLLSERAAQEVAEILRPEDFYRPANGLIFSAMLDLLRKHQPVDILTLEEELKAQGQFADCGGSNYILELANYTPSPSNSEFYAGIVADRATLRRLDQAGRDIVGVAQDQDIADVEAKVDKAEQLIFDVGQRRTTQHFTAAKELVISYMADVDRVTESGKPMEGQKVGFTDLDRKTYGHYPGDLVIIGARPAMGKTSLALDMAINVAKDCHQRKEGAVAIFSLEMSKQSLIGRMATMLSGVSANALKEGEIGSDDYGRVADAAEVLHELPLYIDDSGDIGHLQMRGRLRRLASKHGLSFVIVDYLQLMKGGKKTENRVQEISEIARSLKVLAREFDVPIVALSQLSRQVENRENKRPQLNDLRESGSIEAEADLVLLLYREAYYKAKDTMHDPDPNAMEEAEIIIAKHRNGETGTVKLGFQPAYTRFRNIYRGR